MYTLVRDMVAEHHKCLICQQQINQGEDIFAIRYYELFQSARSLIGDELSESKGLEIILQNYYEVIPEELGSSFYEVVGFCENCAVEEMSKYILGWKPPFGYQKIRYGVEFNK